MCALAVLVGRFAGVEVALKHPDFAGVLRRSTNAIRGVCVVRVACAGGCGRSEQRMRCCRGGAALAACAPLSRPTSSPSFGNASYYHYVIDDLVSEARHQGTCRA
eukprot:4399830-Prymnesium_polylepis.1